MNNSRGGIDANQLQSTTINYRNAIYQGQYLAQLQLKQGRGIVYLSATHQFFASSNFKFNQLSDCCLFFNRTGCYLYGEWHNNVPHGRCICRINQILIIAQYSNGQLQIGTDILILFQKYNTGIILQLNVHNKWEIREKAEVYCSEQLQSLVENCRFREKKEVEHSIVKFINNNMVGNEKDGPKLRLINNSVYRFGFDDGLAIQFDDQFRISTVGCHFRSNLKQIGARFSPPQQGGMIEQGLFDGTNTFSYHQQSKPIHKIQQLYKSYHLSSIKFNNNYLTNPSKKYFSFFQQLIQSSFIREAFLNLISEDSLKKDSFRQLMQDSSINQIKTNQSRKYQILQNKQLSGSLFAKLKNNREQDYISRKSNQNQMLNVDIFKLNMGGLIDSRFQQLPEKSRLQILKKQLFQNVNTKTFPAKIQKRYLLQQLQKSKNKSRIIHMQKVTLNSNKPKQQWPEEQIQSVKKQNIYIRELQDNLGGEHLPKTSILNKHLDIVLRQEDEPSSRNRSKQRKKRKIFQEHQNIRREYSPDTQVSPFKTKMRARIFDKTPQRKSPTPQQKSPTPQQKSLTPQKPTRSNKQDAVHQFNPKQNLFSPHRQFELSREQNNTSSRVGTFPVTIRTASQNQKLMKRQMIESEEVEDEDLQHKKLNNLNIKKYKENIWERESDGRSKKDNVVYRNPILNGQYGKYVYQPINIKQSGNLPYIINSSIKKMSKNKSHSQLPPPQLSIEKKAIGESTPVKRQKMSGYLNSNNSRIAQNYSGFKNRSYF